VAIHQRLERPPQYSDIEPAPDAGAKVQVVGGAFRIQPMQKPQGALTKRKRRRRGRLPELPL
jgi:hypothetical protein